MAEISAVQFDGAMSSVSSKQFEEAAAPPSIKWSTQTSPFLDAQEEVYGFRVFNETAPAVDSARRLTRFRRVQLGPDGQPGPNLPSAWSAKRHPSVVGFLPSYSHSTPDAHKAKLMCLRQLLHPASTAAAATTSHRDTGLLNQCIWKMKYMAKDAQERGFYEDSNVYMGSDFESGYRLLLDGCFVVYLLLMVAAENGTKPRVALRVPFPRHRERVCGDAELVEEERALISFFEREWEGIKCDVAMVSNQIPLSVVRTLWKMLLKAPNDFQPEPFALRLFKDLIVPDTSSSSFTKAHCLLDLVYSALQLQSTSSGVEVTPTGLVGFETIPRVKEMERLGIRFKKSDRMRGIRFHDGAMTIARLIVSDYTKSILRNLIEYEQHHADTCNPCVAAYVKFMATIVRDVRDVRSLYKSEVIEYEMKYDGESVVEFIKDLDGTGLVPIHSLHYLQPLFQQVSKHRLSREWKWKDNLYQLVRKYFDSTSVALSPVAAFVVLALTLIQTLYNLYAYLAR